MDENALLWINSGNEVQLPVFPENSITTFLEESMELMFTPLFLGSA